MPDLVAQIPRHRGNRNKPDESKWRQQSLPAYRVTLDARCGTPLFALSFVIFLTFGMLMLFGSRTVHEIVIDYTNCTIWKSVEAQTQSSPIKLCSHAFNLHKPFKGPVLFQYGLMHFYQNSRMYLKSRNDIQLFGEVNNTEGCQPFATSNISNHEIAIVPCGIIANSIFNDTFQLYYSSDEPVDTQKVVVPFSAHNIISKDVRKRKFRNPQFEPKNNETLCDAFVGTTKPSNWPVPVCQLGVNDNLYKTEADALGVGLENLDFIVWMSPAALPTFRKNYRTLLPEGIFAHGLPAGFYQLIISYNYLVSDFSGRKRFIITHHNPLWPRNTSFGILYIVFAVIMLISCILLLYFQVKKNSRSLFRR